jgi:hypothetical protein
VDELNLNVVAQGNVTLMNNGKASFRMPTVRNSKRPGAGKLYRYNNIRRALARRTRRICPAIEQNRQSVIIKK